MLTEEASRVLLVTHVSVLKKTQDFAHDMKMSFPDRIIVKVDAPSSTRHDLHYPNPFCKIGCDLETDQAIYPRARWQLRDS